MRISARTLASVRSILDTASDAQSIAMSSDRLPYNDLVRHLRRIEHLADVSIGLVVQDMRINGCTWQDVGNLFGVTRQAAEQRFGS
jgi:hypothetical protein